jgi:hypothetical protein
MVYRSSTWGHGVLEMNPLKVLGGVNRGLELATELQQDYMFIQGVIETCNLHALYHSQGG